MTDSVETTADGNAIKTVAVVDPHATGTKILGLKRAVLDDIGKLVLRVGFGLAMMTHGWAKAMGFEGTVGFMDGMLGLPGMVNAALAVAAELGCSILLIVGLGTRLATIPLIFTMGVALFVVHLNDAWDKQEKAVLYLIAYVAILCIGPGRIAIDHLIRRERETS